MDKDVKDQWVAALRSGKYKQGRQTLVSRVVDGVGVSHNKYCCLGVLADITNSFLHDNIHAPWPNDNGTTGQSRCYCAVAGLTPGEAAELASMNDFGDTFEMIADHIEERL